ncbi:MAG: mannose-1-phosphate guanylyltransferase/mannose-6-phosphate isomerase [Desulfovibrionaceae bacterium]
MLYPLILCGGQGTRLWPLSRKSRPKQFSNLIGEKSLLHQTIERIRPLNPSTYLLLSNQEHHLIVEEQMKTLNMPYISLLEPEGKNTAPAVTMAALLTKKEDPTLLILPADHYIAENTILLDSILAGYKKAEEGAIVCFGIVPKSPETSYGYIAIDNIAKQIYETIPIYPVNSFVEKPNKEKAQEYFATGKYFWNAGIFMVKSSIWLAAIKEYAPKIFSACEDAFLHSSYEGNQFIISKEEFKQCPSNSIDYAVMEHFPSISMIPLDIPWNDLGSFTSLYDIKEKDENNNVCIGNVVPYKTKNSYIQTTKKLVSTIGLEDMLIIETTDALLVAKKESAQDIKELVEYLITLGHKEAVEHHIVHRPWGFFETIALETRFQVKCITVLPGEKLSLQLHHHRAEHWVVVEGTGKISNGDSIILLKEDQSTYIPVGSVHRLENPGKIPLKIIEIQTGSYLGEDDIIRLDDIYKRT